MKRIARVNFGLSELANTFQLNTKTLGDCKELNNWLDAHYELNQLELQLIQTLHEDIMTDGNYWNEEELKIEMIGLIFRIANIKVSNKIKVFYERSLQAIVEGYSLGVTTDCLVATPLPYNTPQTPYFFLQEYKKGRGESKDPEAQMLTAMLIAQELNKDNLPVYGSYVFGSRWRFCTLIGKDYCQSKEFDGDEMDDLLQIVFTLRKIKEIILKRISN